MPKTACLLIHGFAGSPFEMEPLVPGLEALGCAVDLPTLPGHGATIQDFRKTYFPDWLQHAQTRLLTLQSAYDRVIPIGFSMGAAIALTLAARHQTHAVVALSAPWAAYRLFPLKHSSWMVLTPILKYFRPTIPLRPPRPAARELAPFVGYDGPLCLPQLHSLQLGILDMRAALPKLNCPMFMMWDINDRVCPPDYAMRIVRAASSTDLSMRLTRMNERITSHHMITTHRDTREQVAAEVAAFVRRMMAE
jgi:carboxylesterase